MTQHGKARGGWRWSAALLGVVAGGCVGGDEPRDDPREPPSCEPARPTGVDAAGAHHGFVVNRIELPATATEVQAVALDIDGDPEARGDNQLGTIVSIIASFSGRDLTDDVQALIDGGEILHLIDLQATSTTTADRVGVTVLHGLDEDDDPTDNFSGDERFAIDAARGSGRMTGTLDGGRLDVDLGTAPIAITFPGLGEPFILHLRGARMSADVTADGIAGSIGGGITVGEVDDTLIPILHEGLLRIIASDCPGGVCPADSFGATLLAELDADHDGVLSLDELRDNSLTKALLMPDLDLLDERGALRFGCYPNDGEEDHLSVSVGFTAVPAVIEGAG